MLETESFCLFILWLTVNIDCRNPVPFFFCKILAKVEWIITKCSVSFVMVFRFFKQTQNEEWELNWFRKKVMDRSVSKEKKVKRTPKHKCKHCDKVYMRSQLLVDHVRSKHENIENHCQKCQKNFSSYETLMNHCRTVHRGFNYNCPDCPKQFRNRSSLYRYVHK